jgi:hypothetical protein
MNHEPVHFLPVKKFWEEDKHLTDRRALWLLIGMVSGTVGTIGVALLLTGAIWKFNH